MATTFDALNPENNPYTTKIDLNNASFLDKTQAEKAQDKLTDDYEKFLIMLTTQLQNQDPTEPFDTNQMTSQLAQLSAVEQQIATNKNMEQLLSLLSSTQTNSVVGYIGKEVEAIGGQAELANGAAYFAYEIPAGADKVTLALTNAAGQVVYSGEGDKAAGKHVFTWDGVNSLNGSTYTSGVYSMAVIAHDSQGKEIKGANSYTVGRVDAVDMLPGEEPVLRLGNIRLPLADVTAVGDAGPQSVVLAQ